MGVLWGCGDGEESPPTEPAGGSAGTSSSEGGGGADDGGTSAGGTSAAGTGGSSGSGAAGDGGTAGTSSGGTSQAGDTSVDGGEPGGGSGGAAGGDAGAGGEGGAPGPHTGPVLDYNFDAGLGLSVLDSSGNALNGVLSVAAWSPQGRNGASLLLLGGLLPTTYVTVPAGVFTDAKATTIAAWVKLTANAPWHRIFDFGNGAADAANRFMYLTPNNGAGLRFSYYGGAAEREATVTTAATLPLNLWKHVAVTLAESGEQTIYVDGFPAGKNASVAIPPSELEPLAAASWLGKSRFDSDAGFAGQMDDFKVYDRVLAPAEIAALAFPKSDYTRITFDEGSGAASDDVSDRGVDATLSDGVAWASGRLGASAVLSGDAQYVTLANPLAGCTDELTLALWVRHDEARPWSRIFDFGGTLDNFMFLTPSTHEGKLQLSIFREGTTENIIVSETTVPPNGTWHHVGLTISTTVATVFIDGESVGSAPSPKTPALLGATNEHWLGKSRFGTDPYFKGAFDEVRISCRAFTPDEMKNLAFR